MAKLPHYRMKLENAAGHEPYVDFDSFSTAAKAWSDILTKLATSQMDPEHQLDVLWVVTGLQISSAEVSIEPRVIEELKLEDTALPQEFWQQMGDHLALDLERLEDGSLPEEVFSDAILPMIYSLISPFREHGVETIEFQFGERITMLTRSGAGRHQRHIVRERSIGSVTGTLTSISFSSKQPTFGLRPEGGNVILCRFDATTMLSEVASALRRRVTVFGELERNEHGNVMLVRRVWELDVHPPIDELPTTDDMFGMDPDFTGMRSSEDWVRMVRGRA